MGRVHSQKCGYLARMSSRVILLPPPAGGDEAPVYPSLSLPMEEERGTRGTWERGGGRGKRAMAEEGEEGSFFLLFLD